VGFVCIIHLFITAENLAVNKKAECKNIGNLPIKGQEFRGVNFS
jgi:hypothetical protein